MLLEISFGVVLILCILQAIILIIIYYNYDQIQKQKIEDANNKEKLEKCEQIQTNIKALLS